MTRKLQPPLHTYLAHYPNRVEEIKADNEGEALAIAQWKFGTQPGSLEKVT